jgi:hypothetical protein
MMSRAVNCPTVVILVIVLVLPEALANGMYKTSTAIDIA